ncbi:MAG: hypothetical protein GY793_02035 [Proteobacteria bacterium]|nr:hypothetical protein [Pseudomonadota bacterium]
MSMTYDIICVDCKKGLWVGQRDYLYNSEQHLDELSKFLHNHKNHHLKFVDENNSDDYKYVGEYGNKQREEK